MASDPEAIALWWSNTLPLGLPPVTCYSANVMQGALQRKLKETHFLDAYL
jgi:hypothetical protein